MCAATAFRANNEAKKQGRAVPKAKKAADEGSEADNDGEGDAVLGAAGLAAAPEGDAEEGAGPDDGADEAEGIELYVDEEVVDEEMEDAGSEGIDEPEPAGGERAAAADDEAEYRE